MICGKQNFWQAKWVLVCVSILIAFGLAEVALRISPFSVVARLKSRQLATKQIDGIHPRGLYVLNDEIGWTLTPHVSKLFRKGDFDITVNANRDGLRDRDYGPKEPETFRILGLGDSFAFGWGLELEESFLKVLEKKLNGGHASPQAMNYEVINGGIPGFGTYEASKLLKFIGQRYEPDLVIVALYEGNDYLNNGEAPRLRTIQNGYLRDVPTKKPSVVGKFLLDHSILAALIHAKVSHLAQKRKFKVSLEKTKRFLLDTKSLLSGRNIPMVLVLIPDQDADFYKRPTLLRQYDHFLSGMDLFEARTAIKVFARENDIFYYKLSDQFESQSDSGSLRLKDTHFNSKGHATAAEEIHQFLRATRLLSEK